jgi:hypothetical protein
MSVSVHHGDSHEGGMSSTRKSTGGRPDCAACEAAALSMKAQGLSDWRTKYACFEDAAVSLEGPEWEALLAGAQDKSRPQPDSGEGGR